MDAVDALFKQIDTRLKESGNAELAVRMSQYMRNKFSCFGIPAPKRKELFREFKTDVKSLSEKELQILVNRLWNAPEREYQYMALLCLDQHKQKLSSHFIYFLESLITAKSWWDTVDWLAPNGCGIILKKHMDIRDEFVSAWVKSPNIWLKRSTLIFQLKYREHTDFELLKKLILYVKGENEFFIQKACGWALRQYSKYHSKKVVDFVQSNPDLSNLAKTEALKWLKRKKQIH